MRGGDGDPSHSWLTARDAPWSSEMDVAYCFDNGNSVSVPPPVCEAGDLGSGPEGSQRRARPAAVPCDTRYAAACRRQTSKPHQSKSTTLCRDRRLGGFAVAAWSPHLRLALCLAESVLAVKTLKLLDVHPPIAVRDALEQIQDLRICDIRPDSARSDEATLIRICLLYTSPSPRDRQKSRMPSSA